MTLLPLLLFLAVNRIHAGNILVLNPLVGHSHVRLLGNLAELLANDGHNVTILSTIVDPGTAVYKPKNPSIKTIVFTSPYVEADGLGDMNIKSDSFWNTVEPSGMAVLMSDWRHFMGSYGLVVKGLLENNDLVKTLQDSKFDLGVTELFDLASIGFLEVLNVRSTMVAASVGMSPWHNEISGIPYFPSFIPSWQTTYGEKMSFWERINTWKIFAEFQLQARQDLAIFNELLRNYNPKMEDLLEIAKKRTGVILSNANEFTESPRLRSNLIQYIGGSNVHPTKPLENEINDLLTLRSKNVFFSFGTFTNVCHMPLKKKMDILEAFAEFPNVTFLWKHEKCDGNEVLLDEYPNVVRRGWWPQSDLLGDPRMNVFITHAGMNSANEAVFRGIPTITIPLFGDQYVNSKALENRGLSVLIKRTELNKDTLVVALKELLHENSTIVKKAKMAGAVMKGKDEEYRQAVLKWANLLIEFGPQEHLFLLSRDLNFFQLYSLDVHAFAMCFVFVVLYTVLRIYQSFLISVKLKKL